MVQRKCSYPNLCAAVDIDITGLHRYSRQMLTAHAKIILF